jgi:hypothetical protein
LPDGKAWRFHFLQEVKSFITHPSFGQTLKTPGLYQISGVAYSGNGRIAKVMVSADGGKSWGEAALRGAAQHPQAFTRFDMAWRWDGQPAVLQSRAWDEAGNAQPLRKDFVAARGLGFLGWNTRYRGNGAWFRLDQAVGDIGIGVRWLREVAGVVRVIVKPASANVEDASQAEVNPVKISPVKIRLVKIQPVKIKSIQPKKATSRVVLSEAGNSPPAERNPPVRNPVRSQQVNSPTASQPATDNLARKNKAANNRAKIRRATVSLVADKTDGDSRASINNEGAVPVRILVGRTV